VIEVDSAGVLKATGNLEIFAKMGQKAGQTTDDVAKKMAAFQLIANKLPGPLNSIAAGLMGMVSPATAVAGALISVGEAAVKYVKESVDAFGKYETIKTNLEVVMGSAEQASKMFKDLRKEVSNTPFNVQQYGDAAATLQKFGVSTRELMPTLKMLGDLSAGSAEKFNNLVQVYAKMTSAEEASAMTMRQLASAGVPIQKLLDDIGRSGETSFEAISEALKKATQEGGKFFGAMEKGSKTLENMKGTVASLKEQHKALQAEAKGWADISKGVYELQIQYYTELNEKLSEQIELRELLAKKELAKDETATVTFTLDDSYREIELKIKKLQRDIKQWEIGENYAAADNLRSQLDVYNAILEKYKPLIDYEKQRLSLIEKQAENLNKVKGSYASAMEFVNSIYEQTAEGQIEKLQKDIDRLIDIQNNQKKTEKGNKFNDSTKKWEQIEITTYLGREEIAKVVKDIDYLNEKLKNLKKIGNPFEDWVKVLARVTGYTEEMVNGLKGLGTVEKYAEEGIDAVRDRFLKEVPDGGLLYEMLGLDKTDVFDEAAEKMRSLVEIMTEARINEPWDIVKEESYQKAIALLQEYKKTASNVHFEKVIEDLDKEYNSNISSVEERIKQKVIEYLQSLGITNPTDDQVKAVMEKKSRNYLAELAERLEEAAMSTYDLAVKRLRIEHQITDEAARQALAIEKRINYIEHGLDIADGLAKNIDDLLRKIRAKLAGEAGEDDEGLAGLYGKYAGSRAAQSGMQMIEGTDVGNFIEGFQKGGIWGAIIETLLGAIIKVLGSMEEFGKALNPITELLSRLEGVISFLHEILTQVFNELIDALKPLLALIGEILQALKPLVSEIIHTITGAIKDILSFLMPLIAIIKAIAPIFEGLAWVVRKVFDALRWFLNILTFGLLNQMNEWADTIQLLDDEQQNEYDRLKAINEQYKNLLAALKEQEEYYLQQRRHLNAEWAIENYQARNVNDMILTPHGVFSTDPQDYIIATKHPENLTGTSGGGGNVYINVINNAGAEVSTRESVTADGSKVVEVLVNAVKREFINGGFDGVTDAVAARRRGKGVTM